MNLSIIDKKCTLDYLDELIPQQINMLSGIIEGGLLTVKEHSEVIETTVKALETTIYDYDTISKVFNHYIDDNKGYFLLDRMRDDLKRSFSV